MISRLKLWRIKTDMFPPYICGQKNELGEVRKTLRLSQVDMRNSVRLMWKHIFTIMRVFRLLGAQLFQTTEQFLSELKEFVDMAKSFLKPLHMCSNCCQRIEASPVVVYITIETNYLFVNLISQKKLIGNHLKCGHFVQPHCILSRYD